MNRAAVLMYHNIGDPPKGATMRGLYVTPLMFRFQMWYLGIAGFRVVPLREMLNFVLGKITEKKMVALTFDDGYQDFYENAYPVLKKYGYPSTVFLISRLIDGENVWDQKELGVKKQLLGYECIHEMNGNNVFFGAHSRKHPFLTRLSNGELESETRGSRIDLEEKLGMPVEFFCYPYGDRNGRVEESVKAAGYLGACTTERGFVLKGDDPFALKRIRISLNTHPLSFIYKLHSDYETRKASRH